MKPAVAQFAMVADGVSTTIINDIDADTYVDIFLYDKDTREEEKIGETTVTDGTLSLTYDTPGTYFIRFHNIVDDTDPADIINCDRYEVPDNVA